MSLKTKEKENVSFKKWASTEGLQCILIALNKSVVTVVWRTDVSTAIVVTILDNNEEKIVDQEEAVSLNKLHFSIL